MFLLRTRCIVRICAHVIIAKSREQHNTAVPPSVPPMIAPIGNFEFDGRLVAVGVCVTTSGVCDGGDVGVCERPDVEVGVGVCVCVPLLVEVGVPVGVFVGNGVADAVCVGVLVADGVCVGV